MSLLLDTHVLIWWILDPARLSAEQHDALAAAEARGEPLGVSAITLWEIAKLVERKRIDLRRTIDVFLHELEASPRLTFYAISAAIAVESTHLGPTFHRDPTDQLIAATARVHGLRLVTADGLIRAAGVVSVV